MSLKALLQIILGFLFFVSISSPVFADTPPALKVYKNDKYGIEIYYPPDFEALDERDEYWKFDYVLFRPVDQTVTGTVSFSFNGPQVGSFARNQSNNFSLLSFFDTLAYAEPPPFQNLGKIKIGGIEGVHEVMIFGQGEIHTVTIHKDDLKIDVSAMWGFVSDNPPTKPLPDYTKDKKVIMDAFELITATVRFTAK